MKTVQLTTLLPLLLPCFLSSRTRSRKEDTPAFCLLFSVQCLTPLSPRHSLKDYNFSLFLLPSVFGCWTSYSTDCEGKQQALHHYRSEYRHTAGLSTVPLLYSLFTDDCTPQRCSVELINFADDTIPGASSHGKMGQSPEPR